MIPEGEPTELERAVVRAIGEALTEVWDAAADLDEENLLPAARGAIAECYRWRPIETAPKEVVSQFEISRHVAARHHQNGGRSAWRFTARSRLSRLAAYARIRAASFSRTAARSCAIAALSLAFSAASFASAAACSDNVIRSSALRWIIDATDELMYDDKPPAIAVIEPARIASRRSQKLSEFQNSKEYPSHVALVTLIVFLSSVLVALALFILSAISVFRRKRRSMAFLRSRRL